MRVLLFFVALVLVAAAVFATAAGNSIHTPRRLKFKSAKEHKEYAHTQQLLRMDIARAEASKNNLKRGDLIWKTDIGSPVLSSPTSTYSTIYVGADDSAFYAIDAGRGNIVYNIYTGGPIRSAATICYSCNKNEGLILFGDNDMKLHALGLDEGYLQWTFATNGSIYSRPFVYEANSDAAIFFGSYDKNIYSIDETGSLNWKFATQGVVSASPQVFNGNLVVGSWDGYVYSLDPASGSLNFKVDVGGIVASACLYSAPNVYCGTMKGTVVAFDLDSGVQTWSINLPVNPKNPSATASVAGRMALLGSSVFVGSANNILYVLDATTGQVTATYDAGAPITNGLDLVDGRVYFGAGFNFVSLFAANATESFVFQARDVVSTRPLVEDRAFFGAGSHVYAVNIW